MKAATILPPRLTFLGVALLALLLLACLGQARFGYSSLDRFGHKWGSDDAYISFRYAQNLAAGHGLVFNAGERVEGYSNLLYVLLLTPAFWLGLGGQIYLVALLLGLAATAAAFLSFFRYSQRQLGPLAWVAAVLFVASPAIWVWAASGLEAPLVLALNLGLWVQAEHLAATSRPGRRAVALLALLAGLSVLTRADGFILPALVAVYLALRGRFRLAALCLAVTGLTFGGQVLARYSYYGAWLPNTYYAKVSGPLLQRAQFALVQLVVLAAADGLWIYLLAWLLAGGAALLARHTRPPAERQPLTFELIVIPGWLAYWVYIGGDTYDERFLLWLFPVGIFLLLRLLRGWLAAAPRRAVLLAAILALAQLRLVTVDGRFAYSDADYDRWVVLGEFLHDNAAGQTLAIDAAGKAPYFSQLPTIDMLGLNDAHIAHQPASFFLAGHNKHDVDYVLGRQPDLIAAWLDAGLNMPAVALTRARYVQAGYEVAYVVAQNAGQPQPIVDVRALPLAEVRRLVEEGFSYGVLARRP